MFHRSRPVAVASVDVTSTEPAAPEGAKPKRTRSSAAKASDPGAAPSTADPGSSGSAEASRARAKREAQRRSERLAVKMLNDRILVKLDAAEGERRSAGGILIPATAQVGKRLAWADVVAVGPNVRAFEQGDKVLFNPEDRYEVEVRGEDYIILRERDIHAVAAERLEESAPGLYL